MVMKKILAVLLAASCFWRTNAEDGKWLTDLPQAEAQAKAESKIVLMDFSGSDWCPDCIALKKKVFDTDRFQAYAATNIVLVDVDFPDKKPQPGDLKKANAELKDKYKIDSLPTLIVLDQNGKELGRPSGSELDSVKALIAALEKYRAGK
jgi:thioredoxin-related protein